MNITFQCSGCGKRYELDEAHAGKKAKCKQCGQAMRVPEAGSVVTASPSASSLSTLSLSASALSASAPVGALWSDAGTGAESIRFRCDGCGKSYSTPAHLAGKKIVCKVCGKGVKIPGDAPEAAEPKAAPKPKSRPVLRIEPDDPPPVDIFGLADDPAPARKGSSGDGILADEPPRPARAGSSGDGDDGPLPQRVVYEPMTDAKRKKIEKRVKKVEKTKNSYAGAAYGVSFGTVLAISLFTWRIYRTVNRFSRIASSASATASAPVDSSPQAISASIDKAIADMVRKPDSAEAADWLDAARYPNHGVMEMPADRARAMVAGFYERGAEKVYVLEPETVGNNVITAQFAIKLPSDPAQRKACLEWQVQHNGGGETPQDLGQNYLTVLTD